MQATDSNKKIFEEERRIQQVRQDKAKHEAQKLADKLQNVSLNAAVQVGEEDKVFGSVTAMDISKLLKEEGYDIDKKDILLEEPIKALGIYNVPVKLHKDITGEVKVWVIKE